MKQSDMVFTRHLANRVSPDPLYWMVWRVMRSGDIVLSFVRYFAEAKELALQCDTEFCHTDSASGWVSKNRRVVLTAGLDLEGLIKALRNHGAVSAKESVCRLWGINPESSLDEIEAILKQRDPLAQSVASNRSFIQKERR